MMQRSTVTRRAAQALSLPCDPPDDETSLSSQSQPDNDDDGDNGDDHGAKHKNKQKNKQKNKNKPLLGSKLQVWMRRSNFSVLLLNLICIFLFWHSGVLQNAVVGGAASAAAGAGAAAGIPQPNNVRRGDASQWDTVVTTTPLKAGVAETAAAATAAMTPPVVRSSTQHHHAIPVRHAVTRAAAAVVSAVTPKVHHAIPVKTAPATSSTTTSTSTTSTSTTSTSAFAASYATDATTGAMQPLACRDFLEQVKTHTYAVEVHDPNLKRDTTIRKTTTTHPFRMSFHHEVFDRPRWEIYTKGRYYEHTLEAIWTDILEQAAPGARVLDVGASTGYYSLLSGSVGAFQIDAFEPNLKNNLRFCESVIMNGWEHEHMVAGPKKSANIHIWPVGLSDTTGTKEFYEWNGNPGAGHFDHPGHTRTDGTELPVTTLDRFAQEQGWFDSQSQSRPTSIPILKIDVEHHETNVLAGAAKLLQSGLVQNIFLDLFQDEASDRESKLRTLELLANSGYKLKAHGQWSGPDKPSPWENDENLANNMMAYLESEHIQNWNLWWTL